VDRPRAVEARDPIPEHATRIHDRVDEELLAGDVCVVSDSDMQDDEGTPAITYGLRGLAYWEVKVFGPFQDLHSGQYGGGVDNPANVLARMLASLIDEHGRVTVPGFYDRVRELTPDEHAAYAAVPFDEADWAERIKVTGPMDGEPGSTLLERLSARPTFDINGLWGGYSGEGSKTIIPAFAGAKISSRLVPDQDHREIEQLMELRVPAVLLFKPVVPALPLRVQESAWLALAMSSTLAGNLTVLGSVANLIVVEQARREGTTIPFWDYCRVGVPVTLLTLAIGIAWLLFVP